MTGDVRCGHRRGHQPWGHPHAQQQVTSLLTQLPGTGSGAESGPAKPSIPQAGGARWDRLPGDTKSSSHTKTGCFKQKTCLDPYASKRSLCQENRQNTWQEGGFTKLIFLPQNIYFLLKKTNTGAFFPLRKIWSRKKSQRQQLLLFFLSRRQGCAMESWAPAGTPAPQAFVSGTRIIHHFQMEPKNPICLARRSRGTTPSTELLGEKEAQSCCRTSQAQDALCCLQKGKTRGGKGLLG